MILYFILQLFAAPAFDFAHYASLTQGQAFDIQSAQASIGRGKILRKGERAFAMDFSIDAAGQSGQGRVELEFKGAERKAFVLDLAYKGQWNNRPEEARETVRADRFLAENGVLAFRFLKSSRFFQLALSKNGQTTVTTDWGTGRLVRRPE